MHPLIEMANHIVAAILAEGTGSGPFRLRSCALDDAGMRLSAWLDHPLVAGEMVVQVLVRSEVGLDAGHQTIRVSVEKWPERLTSWIEPLRMVLEKAHLNLELDLSQ